MGKLLGYIVGAFFIIGIIVWIFPIIFGVLFFATAFIADAFGISDNTFGSIFIVLLIIAIIWIIGFLTKKFKEM
jgi:uncharacterized protein YqgC (DUF456 family)